MQLKVGERMGIKARVVCQVILILYAWQDGQ